MKISCPYCQSALEIDDSLIGEKVQCPNCDSKWIATNEIPSDLLSYDFCPYELPPMALLDKKQFRFVLESDNWKKNNSNLPVLISITAPDTIVAVDLTDSHMILSCSDTQKNDCINSVIISMLTRFSPYELKLMLIDLRIVNLDVYRPLPNLITPLVNNPTNVPYALQWTVNEIDHRYQQMARVRTKNLEAFNSRPPDPEPVMDENGDPIPAKLSTLVVIIDELADIMVDNDIFQKIKNLILQIIAKGARVGIHIILATEILKGDSGFIKKLEAYQSVQVISPPPSGFMITDDEIHKIVDFVSSQEEQHFDTTVVQEENDDKEPDHGQNSFLDFNREDDGPTDYLPKIVCKYLKPDDDENIRKALEIILRENKASISFLQRRMGIGFNKAVKIIEELENRGIVSKTKDSGEKYTILVFDEQTKLPLDQQLEEPQQEAKPKYDNHIFKERDIVRNTDDINDNTDIARRIHAPHPNQDTGITPIIHICTCGEKYQISEPGEYECEKCKTSYVYKLYGKKLVSKSVYDILPPQWDPRQPKKKSIFGKIFLFAVIIFGAFLLIYFAVPTIQSEIALWKRINEKSEQIDNLLKKKEPAKQDWLDKIKNGDPWEVCAFAQQVVEQSVKSPASLRFLGNEVIVRSDKDSDMTKIVLSMNEDPKKIWFVAGEFDAQNSFGALIRTRYSAIIKREANGKYKLCKIDFTP